MSVDLPPSYKEKPKDQPLEKRGYFVAFNHDSLFASKQKLPSDGGKTSHKAEAVKKSGTESDGFRFIQTVRLRSVSKFFTLPIDGIPNCDRLSSNFTFNLWYFQMNYAVVLMLVVLMAVLQIHCRDFTMEVYVTVAVMATVYAMNKLGCQAKVLGRKVQLSEQFTAIITIMVLYNGFLPEAFDFIYFFSGFIFFVVIHASVIHACKYHLIMAKVRHI